MKKNIACFTILFCSGFYNMNAQNAWLQRSDFGGTARQGAIGFSIGEKGYIGTGYDNVQIKKDFWAYH